MRWSLVIACVSCALFVAVQAPASHAASGMFVGVSDDGLEWNTAPLAAAAGDLGLKAVRVTLDWGPGERTVGWADVAGLSSVLYGTSLRVVISAFNRGYPPLDDAGRDDYCAYLADAITRFPQINDVVIWNEPNLSAFWRPQFGAPGEGAPEQYEALAARCYDVLHALRPSVNVIGPATSLWGNDNPNAFDNVSHSPTTFIEAVGAAYRASGRLTPIFDTLGHHPYPGRSDERPWTVHADSDYISVGDLDRLVSTLDDAFGGTAQKTPQTGLPIWYLETGYQTTIPASKASLYSDVENWPGAVPDLVSPEPPPTAPPDTSQAPDQATQLTDELRLTYCQPYVQADFNFMLEDESSLSGWQSGVLWADGTRKGSYDAFKAAIAQVNAGSVDCNWSINPAAITATTGKASTGIAKAKANGTPARSVTKISYLSGHRAAFGFSSLRARLTRGATASKHTLAGRQLLFIIGKVAYLETTNKTGVAQALPQPPLPLGPVKIAVRFQGDGSDLPSGIRVEAQVVNSRAVVQSRGSLVLAGKRTLSFSAVSDGSNAKGAFALHEPSVSRSGTISALGMRSDASNAWLRGTDTGGRRYLIQVKRLPGRRVRIHVAGALTLWATVPASRIELSHR